MRRRLLGSRSSPARSPAASARCTTCTTQPRYGPTRRARCSPTARARGRRRRQRAVADGGLRRRQRSRGRDGLARARAGRRRQRSRRRRRSRCCSAASERYDIYCAPCHSPVGDGDGLVVRRGFPRRRATTATRLRDAPRPPLLRRHHARLRRHVRVRRPRDAGRPLGHRRLHPRAAAEPARAAGRAAGRGALRSARWRRAAASSRGAPR